MRCKHLVYKTERLKKANIGGLCDRRWSVGPVCWQDRLNKLCRGFEVEQEKSEAPPVAVQEDHIESPVGVVAEVSYVPVEEPVKEKKRGRPKSHVR